MCAYQRKNSISFLYEHPLPRTTFIMHIPTLKFNSIHIKSKMKTGGSNASENNCLCDLRQRWQWPILRSFRVKTVWHNSDSQKIDFLERLLRPLLSFVQTKKIKNIELLLEINWPLHYCKRCRLLELNHDTFWWCIVLRVFFSYCWRGVSLTAAVTGIHLHTIFTWIILTHRIGLAHTHLRLSIL